MFLQMTIMIECFAANAALIWSFTCMCSLMYSQMTLLRERFATFTHVRLFATVMSQMYGQRILMSEGLPTDVANERLVTRMQSQMIG
jgi:hypothetical protein